MGEGDAPRGFNFTTGRVDPPSPGLNCIETGAPSGYGGSCPATEPQDIPADFDTTTGKWIDPAKIARTNLSENPDPRIDFTSGKPVKEVGSYDASDREWRMRKAVLDAGIRVMAGVRSWLRGKHRIDERMKELEEKDFAAGKQAEKATRPNPDPSTTQDPAEIERVRKARNDSREAGAKAAQTFAETDKGRKEISGQAGDIDTVALAAGLVEMRRAMLRARDRGEGRPSNQK